MISNELDNRRILLSDAVYIIIVDAYHNIGNDIVAFIQECRGHSPIYEYSPHRIKRAGINDSFALFAVEVEAHTESVLQSCLREGKVSGAGTTSDGARRSITSDEWSICHISIRRNELLSPLHEPHFRPLMSVRIDLRELRKQINSPLRANVAGITAARKWLISLRHTCNTPAIKQVYRDQAKKDFHLSDRQFDAVWKQASETIPNDNWGLSGRPKKP